MKEKTKNKLVGDERKFVVPSHRQIEEDLKHELQVSPESDRKGPYPMPILDFIIGTIGCEMEAARDNEEFGKDDEFYNPTGYIVGVTNGELYYSLYKTILKMTDEEGFELLNLPLCDQQIFAATLELAIGQFMDMKLEGELDQTAVDLWVLFAWCQKMTGAPVWEDENGEAINPPELEKLTKDDWEQVTDDLRIFFLEDSDAEFVEMSLLDEQPHWPTFQEFRTATAWLMKWYRQTRWNRKAA